MDAYTTSLFLYHLLLIPLIFFSSILYVIALSNIFTRNSSMSFNLSNILWPFVTVQIPVYNDPVASRCVEKCLQFDYPKDRFEIVVADDSTDGVTTEILKRYEKKYPGRVKVLHRDSRKGFKPGALNNALKYSRGEIITIFDSDFTPKKTFLKKIVLPLVQNEEIATVQSRMGYLNAGQNLISKFAAMMLMAYHQCWMTIHNRIGTVFFCGTGGAIRRSVLEEMGGWNENSITEDSDLSIKILSRGYKQIYLPNVRASGEVPFTLEGFLRQQMRWAYGGTRAFIDNFKIIFFSGSFSFVQKFFITMSTIGWLTAPFVVGATITGMSGWFLGPGGPVTLNTMQEFLRIFIATSGFIFTAVIALYKERKMVYIKSLLLTSLTIGLVLAFANTVAFLRAVSGKKMVWFRTPKWGSISVLEIFHNLLKQ